MVFPNDPLILFNMLLIGHMFKDKKAISWNFIIKAFFWLIWNEWNHPIFEDKERNFSPLTIGLLYWRGS